MSDLWSDHREQRRGAVAPLAVRMRPRTVAELVGQPHVFGPDQLLTRMLAADRLTSVLFWGPPGTGKTTAANAIARDLGCPFEQANAAQIGVKEIRTILQDASHRIEAGGSRTVLFLDEIHRFSRSQQDVLLRDVEQGIVTLIGATTENPYFSVNSALISRSTVFRFEALTVQDIESVIRRAIDDPDRGFGALEIVIDDDAIAHWARISDGDARRALNALEVAVLSQSPAPGVPITIDRAVAEQSSQAKALVYDGTGDEHYDIVSAFIKSMRGSDPDASVYWLARMLEAGEDPRFIARRMAILASEDVGNADPQAIVVAAAAWELVERIGLPEARLTLAQTALYLAAAPKSNATTRAIGAAGEEVRSGRTLAVPLHLRDRHYKGASELGHGEGYRYPHDHPGGHVEQSYLPEPRVYYQPVDRGFEAEIRRRLAAQRGGAPPTCEPGA